MLSEIVAFLFWMLVFIGIFSLFFTPGGLFILAAIFLVFLVLTPLFITMAMVAAILNDEPKE